MFVGDGADRDGWRRLPYSCKMEPNGCIMEPMEEVGALTAEIVRFVRAFGLHRPDDTPCGAGVSVSEAHALAVLATAPPMTQGKLAAELCLTKSTISRLVDQLDERRWITVGTSDTDRRCRILSLTPVGQAAAAELGTRRRERMAGLLDAIPTDRRADVIDALALLSEAARAST